MIQHHATLASIDPALLTTVSGGGPSMGDRENPSAPALPRSPLTGSNTYWDGIDAGMETMPLNPQMDMGMSKLPPTMTPEGASDGFNGAASSGAMDI
jgi:hypothetical protein